MLHEASSNLKAFAPQFCSSSLPGNIMSRPTTRCGITTDNKGSLMISTSLPIPRCSPQTVLIRVHAVALNPVDIKMPPLVAKEGLTVGNDFAGEIVEIGSEVHLIRRPGCAPWKPGDRVCGAVLGCNPKKPMTGAFSDIIEADPVTMMRFPDHWSWEEGAAVGACCVGAVGLALFRNLSLVLPAVDPSMIENGAAMGKPGAILVYGGSTACGTMALQLLKLAGYTAIATCSPHNFELAQRYGATQCFDYHSPDCVKDIQAYSKRSLACVIDCVATAQSAKFCYEAIGRAGGQYVGLNPVPTEVRNSRKAVKGSWAVGPAASGEEVNLGGGSTLPADAEARLVALKFLAQIELWAEKGLFKYHPVRVLEVRGNWMESVLEGFKELEKGEVSGEKLVVRISA